MILPFFPHQQEVQRRDVEGHMVRPIHVAPTPDLIASLKAPPGFAISRWADGIENPRVIRVHPNGAVYVTQRTATNVVMLRDADRDGVADHQREVARGTDLHGLDFTRDGKWAFMVGIRKLWRAKVLPGGTFGPLKTLMDDLPDAGQHPNRTLAVGPDNRLYISIGSTANNNVEHNPYNATMTVCDLDGKHRAIFASGLRNTIGFDWNPRGGLYGWDDGIDWKGDDECREEVNLIEKGRRYGWPFIYENGKADLDHLPQEKGFTLERWRAESVDPVLLYTAHSSGMQLGFYRGSAFPAEYRGDAFATLHGSWNRRPPSGYEVVRVRFENGKASKIEPFLTGWLQDPQGEPKQFGRPFGLAEMADGSLLVGDDDHGVIYRVAYGPLKEPPSDTTKLSPDLVGAPQTVSVRLRAFGLANSEYAQGESKSPPLTVGALPPGTKALAVAMEDPDAPSIKPVVHWLIADVALASLPFDVKKGDRALGGVQGGNSHGTVGYYGPHPPVGDPPHRYHFTVYALDAKLGLKPGFNRAALLKALRGHVLAQGTTVGKFGK